MAEVTSFTTKPLNAARVLITGGTSGIGLEAAIQYALSSVPQILLNGRDAGRGEQARQVILKEALGAEVDFISADVNEIDGARAVSGLIRPSDRENSVRYRRCVCTPTGPCHVLPRRAGG